MKKQYFFIANWKMHFSFNNAIEFATANYDNFIKLADESKQQIVLCPSFESIYPIIKMFSSTSISIGAQNCSAHISGSFTGQVSPQSLQEIGCNFAIIGHSESRKDLHENNETIAHKCTHLLDYDITPIVCIGESKEKYQKKQTLTVLEQQLKPLFEHLHAQTPVVHKYLTPYIAYEPIWSIGKGDTASTEHIEMVCSWIKDYSINKCPSLQWKIMYGGSISPQNISNLKQTAALDGFLVGNASLDFQKFKKIVQ